MNIKFTRTLADGTVFILGYAAESGAGWRFIPHRADRRPSRKAHDTWEQCIPRWVGYPDQCESEVIPLKDD